jgi:hypothetical protein
MSGAVKRLIKRQGRTWQLQAWVEGAASTDYGRTDKTLPTATNITAIRTETAKERTVIDAQGEERTVDAQLLVDDTVDVSSIEDTTKIAPILTSPSGVQYDGIALGREGEIIGFRRIFLSKRRG